MMLGGADERGVDELQDGALAQKHAGHLGAPACLIALDFPAVGAACERTLQLGRAWPQARDYLGGRLRLLATPASGAQTSSRNHSVFALPPRVRRNRHSQTGSTRPRRRLGQQSGFTLLELLVALVVLGFLVVGLTQGIRTGLAMWGAQTRRLSETAELDAGARVLRMLLTNMTALSPGNVGTGAATPNAAIPNIGASSDKLTFVGDLPTGLGTTRRANITLELNQERLVLRWTPRRHERTTAPEPEPIETELIRGVERLEFAYLGGGFARPAGKLAGSMGQSPIPRTHSCSPHVLQRRPTPMAQPDRGAARFGFTAGDGAVPAPAPPRRTQGRLELPALKTPRARPSSARLASWPKRSSNTTS